MELCPTLDMIGDYLTKALQGSQFRHFRNIILGIHEDDIPSYTYNAPGRSFIEQRKVKIKKNKKEVQKATKIAGD